ncbi:MAG TPA: NADH-ubiquinone oxidoreductase-F iron-sulfur binding region domain-containing protein, partial [bacterium]|nr:NADH-ubiquinone oxidoreductase-F iron-sulfur binding region domain-containing protein [bacterium]
DEGDPGSYIDKLILERDPHGLLEGMAIAGYAIGATRGVIYLRSEYPEAVDILKAAIAEAESDGVLGDSVLGTPFRFHVELFLGSGAYVCGEETAMLRSIEGLRGEVSVRPPFPAEKGLYGKPTVVNNVETLANCGWILEHGGAAYAAVGVGKSLGTKAVSLNSLFVRPGLYEVPLGVTLDYVCNTLGGGLREGLEMKGIQVGGPMGGILPPSLFDTPLGFEELAAVGGLLGHGGIVAFSQHDQMLDLARHFFQFTADESCGKCVPCRIGSVRGVEMVDRIAAGQWAPAEALPRMEELLETMELGSLCALGGGVPAALYSILRHYRGDLVAADRP